MILLFSFFVNFGLGFLVYYKTGLHKKINLTFSVLAWSSAGWVLSVLMIHYFRDTTSIIFWGKMSFVTSSFIPSSFLYFSMIFPREQYVPISFKIFAVYLPTVIFGTLSFTSLILKDVSPIGWGFQTIYGPIHPLFSIYLIGYIIIGLFYLLRTYKYSTGINRLQIKYCFLGMLFTSVFALTTNLIIPIFGTSKYSAIGPSFTMIMVGFTTYSILKHRLMDINIVLKKGTTYVLLLLLLFIPSFILILLGQKIFYGKIDYLFTVMMFSVLFLAAILFHRIKPGTEKAVDHFLFKDRYNYRETLGKFSKAMVNILDLQSLLKRIIETITQTLGVDKASLFLFDDEKGGYNLFESKNIKMHDPTPLLPQGAPLPVYLQKMGEIVVREELAKGANIPELNDVIQQMSLLEAEASIPLISKRQLIGIINLSYKFNKDVYYHEDIELLTTLANQAAIAIENAELTLRARSAEEALTTRKLIERAKDILSQEANILSAEAYRLIQKQSMDMRKTMREVAEAIILAKDIRGKRAPD